MDNRKDNKYYGLKDSQSSGHYRYLHGTYLETWNNTSPDLRKMASGKSTLAQQLVEKDNLLLLSEDELLAKLFPGEVTDLTTYVDRSNRIKEALENTIVKTLSLCTSIVLDFPANTRSQRAWLSGLAIAAAVSHKLHYLDLSDNQCKAQLKKNALWKTRNEQLPIPKKCSMLLPATLIPRLTTKG